MAHRGARSKQIGHPARRSGFCTWLACCVAAQSRHTLRVERTGNFTGSKVGLMIVSHKHKFIFVKNRKVAGTSVEMALAPICGPDDILSSDTPERRRTISPNDELRPHARNFEGRFNPLREALLDPRPLSLVRLGRDWEQRHRFYNHMRAVSIKARLGAGIWESYYTFCFERNPWDKMVSFYYWYHRKATNPPALDDFIRTPRGWLESDRQLPTDWERYTHRNIPIVNDVFDYGDLAGNLPTALARAGVAQEVIDKVRLPRSKSQTRQKRTPHISTQADGVIRKLFHREIAYFGYTPPPALMS